MAEQCNRTPSLTPHDIYVQDRLRRLGDQINSTLQSIQGRPTAWVLAFSYFGEIPLRPVTIGNVPTDVRRMIAAAVVERGKTKWDVDA